MAFPRLRTAGHRRRRVASESQQPQRPRTAPALMPPPPPPPPRDLDTSTLHSSLAPTGPELRHCSATLAPVALATSDGIREERNGNGNGNGEEFTAGAFVEAGAANASLRNGDGGEGREDLIQHMRDQLSTANSVIRFLHEHVDGMREDRDRYRDRVEELKSLARLTLDMLEGAHRREWEVCREVRKVQERAVEKAGEVEEEGDKQPEPRARRRDSLMRKIGLGRKEGKEKEREKKAEMKAKHDSAREDAPQSVFYENNPPTMPPIEQPPPSGPSGGGGAAAAASSNARRKRGHVKSHSVTNARLRDDGVLTIPADELERLVQAMDRNVNVLREDIKKLVDEVNTHRHTPVYTSLTDVPPRFG
ncbi:hypothetical protein SLS57_003595 [Botryosphaeria dothidea]